VKEARPAQDPRSERLARLRRGSIAELIAAGVLIAKGYRILARRHRTPHGEIDVIAARWGRVAFVEVKRRATMAECEAALTPRQAERIGRAADYWLARHARFREHEVGLDAILVVPGQFPRHLPNALDQA
jgi:putative endonuclease